MFQVNEIRQKMQAGKATVGTWLQLPSPDVAEILGGMGYDWVAVDMEHAAFTRAVLPDVFRAIECAGSLPFARLPEAKMSFIKDALDSGAQGLIFPMIESRSQLDQAIAFSLYPGDAGEQGGVRGVGYSRANRYGLDFETYRKSTAKNILLVAQIENIHAVENLDEILDSPRLDAIMVGPYDLSGSMGLTGCFDHPKFLAAMDRIAALCRKHGIPMGAHVVQPDPELLKKYIHDGYRFLAYGIDAVFLQNAAHCPDISH